MKNVFSQCPVYCHSVAITLASSPQGSTGHYAHALINGIISILLQHSGGIYQDISKHITGTLAGVQTDSKAVILQRAS